jgi:hypothetical protein
MTVCVFLISSRQKVTKQNAGRGPGQKFATGGMIRFTWHRHPAARHDRKAHPFPAESLGRARGPRRISDTAPTGYRLSRNRPLAGSEVGIS